MQLRIRLLCIIFNQEDRIVDSKLIASLLKGQINEEEIKQLERQYFEEYGIEINPPKLIETNKESLLLEFRKRMERLSEIKEGK